MAGSDLRRRATARLTAEPSQVELDDGPRRADALAMVVLRLLYTAAVMVAVIALLRAGNPVGGLLLVPAAAVLLRRDAESGRLATQVRRARLALAPRP